MLNRNNPFADSQTFNSARLGISISYDTHFEKIFLQDCEVDLTIEHIVRVMPGGGTVDRRHPGVVFPAFVVTRRSRVELVVLLNSPYMPRQTNRELGDIKRMAFTMGWAVVVKKPENSKVSRAYRKLNKERGMQEAQR